MTFRDDLDAAHARIESLERENERLTAENDRLKNGPKAASRKQPSLKVDADNKVVRRRRVYDIDSSVMMITVVMAVLALAYCQTTS